MFSFFATDSRLHPTYLTGRSPAREAAGSRSRPPPRPSCRTSSTASAYLQPRALPTIRTGARALRAQLFAEHHTCTSSATLAGKCPSASLSFLTCGSTPCREWSAWGRTRVRSVQCRLPGCMSICQSFDDSRNAARCDVTRPHPPGVQLCLFSRFRGTELRRRFSSGSRQQSYPLRILVARRLRRSRS